MHNFFLSYKFNSPSHFVNAQMFISSSSQILLHISDRTQITAWRFFVVVFVFDCKKH